MPLLSTMHHYKGEETDSKSKGRSTVKQKPILILTSDLYEDAGVSGVTASLTVKMQEIAKMGIDKISCFHVNLLTIRQFL